MGFEIITNETRLSEIAAEWDDLHGRAARFPFADPATFIPWWQLRGKPAGCRLHIVTQRSGGRLVALAPLVVARRHGFRFLEWGGNELYDYCDTLAVDDAADQALWSAVRHTRLYDFGLLRDVHPGAVCRRALSSFAQRMPGKRIPQIRLGFPSSAAWMETLSPSTRSYYRRAERRLQKLGPLRFEVCRARPVPGHILHILLQQKIKWLRANHERSWMSDETTDNAALLSHIAEAAADAGCLHLSWLDCGGSIIAAHFGLEHQGVLHWYIPSYDMDWGKYAPGRLLLLKLIAWAIDHGLSGFDFMRGDEPYKSRLANTHQQLSDFVFASSYVARLAGPWLIPWYARRHADLPAERAEPADLVSEDL